MIVAKDPLIRSNVTGERIFPLCWNYFMSIFNNSESNERFLIIDASPNLCPELLDACMMSDFGYISMSVAFADTYKKNEQTKLLEEAGTNNNYFYDNFLINNFFFSSSSNALRNIIEESFRNTF